MREGTIENNLIYYKRPDTPSPNASDIQLVPMELLQKMKALLSKALGVDIIVKKQRDIYFINNLKFHIDMVHTLGKFVEIEAIDKTGASGKPPFASSANITWSYSISANKILLRNPIPTCSVRLIVKPLSTILLKCDFF